MYVRKSGRGTSAGQQSSAVLLRTLTERDSELGAHLGGVAGLVCATIGRLERRDVDLEAAQQAGLLHDVGKIAIPDAILNKAGPLDDAEWTFMKRHTLIGERIISAAPALTAVSMLVRSTHEHYDGSGYPDGLAGSDIPLISRVVAVCDAYDAITTDRVYCAARSSEDALTELRRCAGTQFDPAVVTALAAALESASGRIPGGADADALASLSPHAHGAPTSGAAHGVALRAADTSEVFLEV
jgi:HD-GYP domain-containing protein (c-di-GMP phosphodiesterase class II)